MPTVALTLLAGQGTGRTDRAATICSTLCIKIKKHCGDINMYMYDGINMIFFWYSKTQFLFHIIRCMSACISSYQKILSKQNRQNLILYWPTQKLPLYAAMNTLQTTLYKMLSFQNEFYLILAHFDYFERLSTREGTKVQFILLTC